MAKKQSSPFDDFWWGPQKQEDDEGQDKEQKPGEETDADWSSLLQEVSKTWKSISPMVKPFVDKFKK